MLTGCATTTPVCLVQPSEPIQQPEEWAMAEPQQPTIMPEDPSNGESLQVTTTNNKYWSQDRLKIWYLQSYVKQLLMKEAANNNNNNNVNTSTK